jgi:DNA-binding NtrC family response regulator
MQAHSWPGNVRELANFMRRVLALSEASEIDAQCFEMEFHGNTSLARLGPVPVATLPAPVAPAGTPIWQVEKLHLEKTLALTDGNRTVAAEMLGISLRTLRNKIREYGLPPRRYA